MLTIQNIRKVWKRDVGEWRIGKIETTHTAYLFKLYKFNRRENIQINLERTAIGQDDTALYELWYWKGFNINPSTALPQRMLLNRNDINDAALFLTHLHTLLYK